jgi:hypothetical protein
MQGQRRKRYPNGTYGWINSTWSTNITDYDALCCECHEIRDSKTFFETRSGVPGVPLHFLSPATADTSQEARNGR